MNRIINLASTFCINYDESERFSVYPADARASNLLQGSMVGSVGELQVPWIGEGSERSVKVLGLASGMTMCDGVEPASTPLASVTGLSHRMVRRFLTGQATLERPCSTYILCVF
jgi:hypothetical protein